MERPVRRGPAEKIFGTLLHLYPRGFRASFEPELLSFFHDDRDRARRAGWSARLAFWPRTLLDLVRTATRQRMGGASKRPVRGPVHRGGSVAVIDDLRSAIRALRSEPGFVLLAGSALALGVGATTAIWSVVDGVLMRPLPYPDASRIVQVGTVFQHDPDGMGAIGAAEFFDLRGRSRAFDSLVLSGSASRTVVGEGEPRIVRMAAITEGFFELLGAAPVVGRAPAADEFRAGAPVIVLGHSFWESTWGADPGILGRSVVLDGTSFTVIGVLAAGFRPPEALWTVRDAEAWIPLELPASASDARRGAFQYNLLGRLPPGGSLEAGRDDADALFRAIGEEHYGGRVLGARVEPLEHMTVGDIGETLGVMLLAAVVLLLIACANVANLLLARATRRRRELAVRTALGAARGRIVRQLVVESILLGILGGSAGVALAYQSVAFFRSTNPGGIPRLAEVAVDGRGLAAALAVSCITGILFGLAPALRAARVHPSVALRDGAATAGDGPSTRRLRAGLVVAQTGLAFVLLIGAGLLARSFVRLATVDPGFDADGLARVMVRVTAESADGGGAPAEFFNRLHARAAALPGVEAAALTSRMPYTGEGAMWALVPEGWDPGPGQDSSVFVAAISVTTDYFEILRVPLLNGRGFTAADRAGTEPVAIVNEAFARTYWPDAGDVRGRRIAYTASAESDPPMTVVGMVADVRYRPSIPALPEVYVPYAQSPTSAASVIVRTTGDAASLVPPLRRAVWDLDPTLPIRAASTVNDIAAGHNASAGFYASLLGAFAIVALALALVGIYGMLAYSVGQRTREIGIRVALGASRGGVVTLVLGDGVRLVAAGIGLGAVGAWATSRLLSSLLFDVAPTDTATFVVAAVSFLATATLASWMPARRAAGGDPAAALRNGR